MTIPERIKEIRESLKITQQELADKTGISKSFIGNVESGKQTISFDFLIKLTTTFDISGDWLLYGTGNMYRKDNEFVSQLDEDWLFVIKAIEKMDIETKLSLNKLFLAAFEAIENGKKSVKKD